MPKYNLYRIWKEHEEELIGKLKLVGLVQADEKVVDEYSLKFFFSNTPDTIDIWWASIYEDFLVGLDKPKNLVYFGVFLVSSENFCYAVSLGKSHFYLRQFSDTDFGLNLAERIVDENDLRIKNTKFYKSIKNKIITTYQRGSEITFDSGESMHFLKAKTIAPSVWGMTANFGTSVQFTLTKQPSEIPDFLFQVEEELKKPARVEFPRADLIKDEKLISQLDVRLAKAIVKAGENSSVNIDEFSVSGVDFIFSDKSDYSLYVKGQSDEKLHVGELSLEKLVRFIKEQGVDLKEKLNDIRVYIHNEHGRDYSQELKYYLDFIDEEERYCLIDGKWHKFNQSYLKYLEREVDSINLTYEPRYDIPRSIDEDTFNKDRERDDGFINYDKSLESLDGKYRVEKMDLYKDEALFFVKIGNPQKLSYVIDQAVNTVKILQNKESQIEVGSKKIKVKDICLWIVLERKTKLSKLSEINSIIFLMKLVDWKKTITEAGFKPLIYLNYVIG